MTRRPDPPQPPAPRSGRPTAVRRDEGSGDLGWRARAVQHAYERSRRTLVLSGAHRVWITRRPTPPGSLV